MESEWRSLESDGVLGPRGSELARSTKSTLLGLGIGSCISALLSLNGGVGIFRVSGDSETFLWIGARSILSSKDFKVGGVDSGGLSDSAGATSLFSRAAWVSGPALKASASSSSSSSSVESMTSYLGLV